MTETDLEVRQGKTFARTLVFKTAGAADDLTGCTLRGQVRTGWAGSLLAEFAFDLSTLATGRVPMGLSAAATAAMPAGNYVYEVELVRPDGTTIDPGPVGRLRVYAEACK